MRIMSGGTFPASTSGRLSFEHSYSFSQGGPVESGVLPFPVDASAPFEVARWSVAPGKANDLDVHVSREVWLVISGEGHVTWADQSTTIKAGDAIAFDTKIPHQVCNVGSEPLRVFSVYWKQADRGPDDVGRSTRETQEQAQQSQARALQAEAELSPARARQDQAVSRPGMGGHSFHDT
jgi:mannose-6-phosphate isomerase-like protein (cupin superfamily)